MNTPNSVRPNGAAKTPPNQNDSRPISISVVIIIADVRKSSRVVEVGREESFATSPEALASLPGHLNSLVRGAGGDAQVELIKFLKLLAQPEPPVAGPTTSVSPAPPTCSATEPETPVAEVPSLQAQNPEGLVDDYLLALDVTLLGTLP